MVCHLRLLPDHRPHLLHMDVSALSHRCVLPSLTARRYGRFADHTTELGGLGCVAAMSIMMSYMASKLCCITLQHIVLYYIMSYRTAVVCHTLARPQLQSRPQRVLAFVLLRRQDVLRVQVRSLLRVCRRSSSATLFLLLFLTRFHPLHQLELTAAGPYPASRLRSLLKTN